MKMMFRSLLSSFFVLSAMVGAGLFSFGPVLGACMALVVWGMFFTSTFMFVGLVVGFALIGAFMHSYCCQGDAIDNWLEQITGDRYAEHMTEAMAVLDRHISREADGTFTVTGKPDVENKLILGDLLRSLEQTNDLIKRGEIDPKEIK